MNHPPQDSPFSKEARPRGTGGGRLSTGAKAVTAAVASAAIAFTGLPAVQAQTSLPAVGSAFKFDFGPGTTEAGYTQVAAATGYSAAGKFGFTDTAVTSGVDRGTGDALRSDFVQAQGSSFLVDLPNGDYTVKLIAGDAAGATNIAITAEKMAKVQMTDKAAGQYLEMEFPISLVDGQLNLDFSGRAAKINSLVIAARAPRTATTDPGIYLAGDSTVQTYDSGYVPQSGWGQMIDRFFDDKVALRNHAIGGRSSKNFISQGRLDEILRVINPGDYLMVQFTTATVPTANLAGLAEGTAYNVRVAAMNGKGLSQPSDPLNVTTKEAKYRFDFGPVGAPVEAGYTGVNRTMAYTAERGFGFKDVSVLSDRDRGAVTTNLLRDFVLSGASFEFQLDVPNGTYALKTYHSDWIGSTRTDVAAEGTPYGQVASSKASSATKIINQVLVSDGQLNLTISGSGQRLNGLEVTPLLVGPTNLHTTAVDAAAEPPVVDLAWDAVGDAASYTVFRQASFETERQLIAENVMSASYRDNTAFAGLKYTYSVTAVDNTGLESVPSNSFEVALVDPGTTVPAATPKLDVKAVEKTSVSLKWQKVAGAAAYQIYRSTSPDGPFEYAGRATEVNFTDFTILTTIYSH